MHEGPGSFKGQRAAYRTNLPQMVKTRATYTAHMPGKGQFLVQGHPQVPHSSGKQDTLEACSRIERSILANCTWPPTKMNCDFPGFNLRRFEDNQAPITSEYILHFQLFHKLLKTLLFGRAWERLRVVTLKGRYKLI